jgi:hypothetical protein
MNDDEAIKRKEAVRVAVVPDCDFCGKRAAYDGKTVMGPWANMCADHFVDFGLGLGLGRGQRLILVSP